VESYISDVSLVALLVRRQWEEGNCHTAVGWLTGAPDVMGDGGRMAWIWAIMDPGCGFSLRPQLAARLHPEMFAPKTRRSRQYAAQTINSTPALRTFLGTSDDLRSDASTTTVRSGMDAREVGDAHSPGARFCTLSISATKACTRRARPLRPPTSATYRSWSRRSKGRGSGWRIRNERSRDLARSPRRCSPASALCCPTAMTVAYDDRGINVRPEAARPLRKMTR
jgi:hypothetical protein